MRPRSTNRQLWGGITHFIEAPGASTVYRTSFDADTRLAKARLARDPDPASRKDAKVRNGIRSAAYGPQLNRIFSILHPGVPCPRT